MGSESNHLKNLCFTMPRQGILPRQGRFAAASSFPRRTMHGREFPEAAWQRTHPRDPSTSTPARKDRAPGAPVALIPAPPALARRSGRQGRTFSANWDTTDQRWDLLFALHNVKRGPYKVKPLPYILRFFRKPLTAEHISRILRKASSNCRLLFANCAICRLLNLNGQRRC